MKWHEMVGSRPVAGDIGLEIETESLKHYAYVPGLGDFWSVHNDGSLRNIGVEYVFSKPYMIDGAEYKAALEVFDKQSKAVKFETSTYTSVHVHLNISREEMKTIANFFTIYFIVEELLNQYCGPDRDGNLFCLKTSVAESTFHAAKEIVEAADSGPDFLRHAVSRLQNNQLKYSALNIYALRHFGSLEVRTHPGSTNVEVIDRWVHILWALILYARRHKSPVSIVNNYHDTPDKRSFLLSVFGEYRKYFVLDNLEERLSDGVFYATLIANSSQNWANFGSNPPKTVEERKRVKTKNFEGLTNDQIQAMLNTMAVNPVIPEVDV